MSDYHLNLRRFFRNRLELYSAHGPECKCADESSLTFAETCELLADDTEVLPHRYRDDMRKICGHEHLAWFRHERSYGDAAAIIRIKLNMLAGSVPSGGLWVNEALRGRMASMEINPA
jgi:hypothetical protein